MTNAPAYVVRIDVQRANGDVSTATGVLVRGEAVLTCEHVVADAAEIRVFPPYALLKDGAVYRLTKSLGEDLALIEPVAPLGIPVAIAPADLNWKSHLAEGDTVAIWGYSTGKNYASAQYLEASVRAFSTAYGRIGLTAPVNPGDSGGPVLENGRVVALVQGKDDEHQAHALAIPITLAPADLFGAAAAPNLPELPEVFVGRDADVQRILAILGRKRLTTVVGLAGIGKTECAKAVAAAAGAQEWAADGVVYVDLQAATSASEVMGVLGDALALGTQVGETQLLAAMRSRRLFVLDDLHQALRHDGRSVRRFVHKLHEFTAPARVLITSGSPIGINTKEVVYTLHALKPPHDGELLRGLITAADYPYADGDDARLATLVEELEGYPLALTIAANLLQDASLEEVLRRWKEKRTAALKLPGIGDEDLDHLTSVHYALALSWGDLSDEESRTLVGGLAFLPAGGRPALFDAISGGDSSPARQVLERAGFLHRADGRYRAYSSVREFAARVLDAGASNRIRENIDRALEQFVAETVGDAVSWRTSSRRASAELTAELPNLHAALDRAAARKDHAFVSRLTDKLAVYYSFALPGKESRSRLEAGIAAAAAVDDPVAEANLTYALADVGWIIRGIDIRGLFERAMKLYEQAGRRGNVASCLWSLTFDDLDHERWDDMIRGATKALEIFTEVNDDNGRGLCIKTIGDAERFLGRLEDAERHYRQALSLFTEAKNIAASAEALRQLGEIALRKAADDHPDDPLLEEASRLFHQAHSKFDEAGHYVGMAHTTFDMADVELERGHDEMGLELLGQARREFDRIGDVEGTVRSLLRLADFRKDKGDREGARATVEEARALIPGISPALGRKIEELLAEISGQSGGQ